jgi:hypothetical protein
VIKLALSEAAEAVYQYIVANHEASLTILFRQVLLQYHNILSIDGSWSVFSIQWGCCRHNKIKKSKTNAVADFGGKKQQH